jgi:hypothetical protein
MSDVRLSIDAMFIKMFVKRCRRLAKTRHGRERTKRGGSWPVEGSFSKDKKIKVLYTLQDKNLHCNNNNKQFDYITKVFSNKNKKSRHGSAYI